jgi:hypothetical protein
VIPDASDPAKSTVYIIVGAIDNLKDSIENILSTHGFPINPPPTLSISLMEVFVVSLPRSHSLLIVLQELFGPPVKQRKAFP